ncbi:DNA polymerase/3'-5' exonuclease PolX [Candidatus Marsarchaeota archaeon]|jgi:DNA polymerase (family 10)|nr:DNA polymerase/3'-5' exonuclease PolX [Candidatus Marsarchaeota archaeon]MCL5089692.1 DNA polymerase/3'-5' exonuclease PolX [Candidatus Marsarchaeota archaeon]
MENKLIAFILNEIADMLSIDETETSKFEVRAYKNAALVVESLQEPIEEIYQKGGKEALMELPGIGKGLAEKIEEYLTKGRIEKYEKLKKKYPINFFELTSLEGIGAKTAVLLYQKLKIKNIADLKKAIEEHKIREVPNFGIKSEEEFKRSIKLFESGKGRILLGEALPIAESIINKLLENGKVKKAVIAGSVRRMKETVGDIDILAITGEIEKTMDYFTEMEEVQNVISKGQAKTTVWLKTGISCDLRVIKSESFGAAQQYFIGSKEHNIEVRKIALKNKLKLNEYGLFDSNGKMISGEDEHDIYEKLGLQYIPPEMRENKGEIELAAKHKIPKLVELSDIKGDLHTHTKDSDGINSIEEMAEAALQNKFEYFATTNHTKSLKIAHGMNESRFREFFKNVDKLNDSVGKKIKILKGAEVDILRDGSLDLEKDMLKEMDCVLGSIHSFFKMGQEEMTKRVINAIDSGLIHIFAHPTGRIINERMAYNINLDKVAEAAERNKVALEINSFPNRLDLNDANIFNVSKYKILFSIDSDAHNTSHFQFLRYGVGTAKRGWLTKERILNAKPYNELIKALKK